MARLHRISKSRYAWLACLAFTLTWKSSASQTFPSLAMVQSWADKLDNAFLSITSGQGDLTQSAGLQKAYEGALEDIEVKHADGRAIVTQLAQDMEQIFQKNLEALQKLQEGAEEAIKGYEYNEDLVLPLVDYVNMNDLQNSSGRLDWDRRFGQDISRQQSGVHIPIEIYEGYNPIQMTKICPTCTSVCDLCQNSLFWRQESRFGIQDTHIVEDPEILNGIEWSQALDPVFKANQEQYPDIFWQSFGSQDGYMRVFPTARWRTFGELPDLYDVRRRPWYIHGSVSPKDVVILLDTSGSMHGQSLDIMKLAAKTLLNTLGEDDFVNVAQFALNVTWVTPCLTGLVQANSRNKRLLFDGIDKLVDHQIANYTQALEYAYESHIAFDSVRHAHDGAECHKLIMVFSDGGTTYPKKVIDSYRNGTNPIGEQVRIFTYAVGPHPLPTVALKNMACTTGGSFSTIIAMGSIRTKIQDYARVLNKVLVISGGHNYLKTTGFSRDHLGLGLVTTITLPVFNMSSESDGQTLAGVVGIDIPTSKFEQLTPFYQLGPNGYSFGLNQNGFLVFHPFLWMNVNFLEEPTHIDLADVEGTLEDVEVLREAMINQPKEPGLKMVENPLDLEERVPLIGVSKEFHFATVPGSSFAIAVALDKNWNYATVKNQDLSQISILNQDSVMIAPWSYCQETSIDKENTLDTLKADLDDDKCSGTPVEHLAWDLKVAKAWFDQNVQTNSSGVLSKFITTDGGLTVAFPEMSLDSYFEFRDPYNSSFFRKTTLDSSQAVLHVTKFIVKEIVPIIDEATVRDSRGLFGPKGKKKKPDRHKEILTKIQPATLHLAKAIQVEVDGVKYVPAIIGVELEHDFLEKLLLKQTQTEPGSAELGCLNSTELICMLVDHAGHVLGSNQPQVELGDFLGTTDPQLMKQLVEADGIFVENVETNYQGLCANQVDCSFGTRSLFIPTLDTLYHGFHWIFDTLHNLGYLSLSFLALLFLPESSMSVSEYSFRMPEGMHRCTTNTSYWSLNPELKSDDFHERISGDCKECSRDYHIYKLSQINALLIVSDPKCISCNVPSYKDKPIEVDPEALETCHLPKRFRKRPPKCFSRHEEEIPECSSASPLFFPFQLLKLSMALIPIMVSVVLVVD